MQLPKWYIPALPVIIIRKLKGDTVKAAVAYWGLIAEKSRLGKPLTTGRAELVEVLKGLGFSKSKAYRAISELMEKRFLDVALASSGEVPTSGEWAGGALVSSFSEDGDAALRPAAISLIPGPVLQPYLSLFPKMGIPNFGNEYFIGGGGGNIHESLEQDDIPPPPFNNVPKDGKIPRNGKVPKIGKVHQALVNLAQKIGILDADKLELLARTGFGPRRLWTWWQAYQASGAGVGAFLRAIEKGETALAPPIPRVYTGPDFCPNYDCGAEIVRFTLSTPEQCDTCRTRVRVCECGELAPQTGACPWCGVLREQGSQQLAP